jgi:hypothetical protein
MLADCSQFFARCESGVGFIVQGLFKVQAVNSIGLAIVVPWLRVLALRFFF